jgi:hypothetical protein
MVFNATFNNISISWWSVLLVEETGENLDLPQVTDKLMSHNVVSSTPRLVNILSKKKLRTIFFQKY